MTRDAIYQQVYATRSNIWDNTPWTYSIGDVEKSNYRHTCARTFASAHSAMYRPVSRMIRLNYQLLFNNLK